MLYTDRIKNKMYRIIDANLNRSREGLRVCEEVVRFGLEDDRLNEKFRKLRHTITETAKSLPITTEELLASRDSESDVGNRPFPTHLEKINYRDIFISNMQRTQEALRVLEEFSSIVLREVAENFRSIRFQTYTLEKDIVERLSTIRDNR